MSKPNVNTFRKLSAIILTLAILSGILAVAKESSNPNESLPAGPTQDKAVAACSTCHEARIIVQQRLNKAAWTKEIDKMMKWGAEVDPKDRDALVDYFSANFGPDQPAYAAPKSAVSHSTTQAKRK